MNRENLLVLAKFLVRLDQDGHESERGFSMRGFCDDEYGDELEPKAWECGTVSCAAGWGPAAGLVVEPDDEDWSQYITRTFGIDGGSAVEPIWQWLFGSGWARTDNSPKGAGQRILWLLVHGVPEDWKEQMTWRVPLGYKGIRVEDVVGNVASQGVGGALEENH